MHPWLLGQAFPGPQTLCHAGHGYVRDEDMTSEVSPTASEDFGVISVIKIVRFPDANVRRELRHSLRCFR